MTNAKLAPANLCGWGLLVFSLLLGGCMNSSTGQSETNSSGSSREIRLEVMFQNRSEVLTPEEATTLREYLKGVATRTPEGSPSPRLKYRVRIDVDSKSQFYYFKDDGSLMLAKSPPTKADEIQHLIVSIASRIPQTK